MRRSAGILQAVVSERTRSWPHPGSSSIATPWRDGYGEQGQTRIRVVGGRAPRGCRRLADAGQLAQRNLPHGRIGPAARSRRSQPQTTEVLGDAAVRLPTLPRSHDEAPRLRVDEHRRGLVGAGRPAGFDRLFCAPGDQAARLVALGPSTRGSHAGNARPGRGRVGRRRAGDKHSRAREAAVRVAA